MRLNLIGSVLGNFAKSKRCMLDSALVALVTAAFFCLILPTQSYLACADLFPYEYSSLFWALIWRCALVGLALFVLLSLSYFRCRGLVHILLLSLVVAGILESGPLAIGLPELNGDMAGYQSFTRKLVDSSVLVLALILPFVLLKYIRQYAGWISVALLFYSSLSLFDVKRPDVVSGSGEVLSPQILRQEVVESVYYSTKKNVMVLILDAISSDVAADVFAGDPELAKRFSGFVNYIDNLGMQWTTAVAIPALFSGMYFEKTCDLSAYSRLPFTSESFAADYVAADSAVFVNVGPYSQGYSNRSRAESHRRNWDVRTTTMHGEYQWTVEDLAVFRLTPYCWKSKMLLTSGNSKQKQSARSGNAVDWKGSDDGARLSWLGTRPVTRDEDVTLHVHHVKGGHRPIVHDADGNRVLREHPTYADYRDQCHYAFRQVADLFDAWKTNGVYDASHIVLLGDHGELFTRPGAKLRGVPQQAFPFLMIKPREADAPYEESRAPTSHARIAELVRELRLHDLTRREIESVISQKERKCQFARSGKIQQWFLGPDGLVSKREIDDAEPEIGNLKPLQAGTKYCFAASLSGAEPYPDFSSDGGVRSATTGLAMSGKSDLRLRVRSLAGVYDVKLWLNVKPDGRENSIFVSAGNEEECFDCGTSKGYLQPEMVLKSLVPDKDGVITIKIRQTHPGRSYVVLKMIQLDNHIDDDSMNVDAIENGQEKDRILPDKSSPIRLKLSDIPECANLHLSGRLMADGQTDLNRRAGIVLVRAFNQQGSELIVSNLVFSPMFKCGYRYLPVGKGGTPFSFDVRLPTATKRGDLSLFRFQTDKEVVLSDFECRVEACETKSGDQHKTK